MRYAPLLLVALGSGCGAVYGPWDDVGPSANGLRVRFAATSEGCDPAQDDDCVLLEELEVRVDELVLTGEGPGGPVSVSNSAPIEVAVVGGSAAGAPPAIELATGTWRDVRVVVHLRPGDDAALEAAGRLGERGWELEVEEELELVGEADRFEVGEGPDAEVVVTFDVASWFDGMTQRSGARSSSEDTGEDTGDGEDTGGEDPEAPDDDDDLDLDPDSAPAAYAEVVARIADTTRFTFPGEAAR